MAPILKVVTNLNALINYSNYLTYFMHKSLPIALFNRCTNLYVNVQF